MKLSEFLDWLDDYDQPYDTNWDRVCKFVIWLLILGLTSACYLYLFSIFGDPQ